MAKERDPLSPIMTFGKYRGCSVREIADRDPGYIDWLQGTEIYDDALRAAVHKAAELYEKEIAEVFENRE